MDAGNVFVSIVFLIVGAALGLLFDLYLKRPKLIVAGGGGGGGGTSSHSTYVTIASARAGVGFQIRETTIWGRGLWGGRWWGLPIRRDEPGECYAQLLDAHRKYLSPLYWRVPGSPEPQIRLAELLRGTEVSLLLLAQAPGEPYHYFFFRPGPDGLTPAVLPVEARLSESRDFIVRVVFADGARKLDLRFNVIKQIDGTFRYSGAMGAGSLQSAGG
jgi:hypothetical protein